MKKRWMNSYIMNIWIYLTFSRILFQRFIQGQQGHNFAMNKMTWENAYDYCALRGQRLVYSMNSIPLLYLPEVLAEFNISLLTIWTIHKVNNETPKGTRSIEKYPITIGYNLSELASVLCVYLVYEENSFLGWEADECKNEAVVHHLLCSDSVNGFMEYQTFLEISLYQEQVNWKEAKIYCGYKSSTMINLTNGLNYASVFGASLFELNLTSEVSFWSKPLGYPNVVVDETVCDYGFAQLHYVGYAPMGSDRESCTKSQHYIMCEKQTEKLSFVEITNHITVNRLLLKSIISSSTVECEDQCIAIIDYGIACAGFNYNWTSKECLFMAIPYEFYLNELRNPADFYNNEFARTGGMSAFIVLNGKMTVGEYKPINQHESTELQIQDNDKTYPMVTDKKASTLGKTITTTKPASTGGGNAAGRLLTIAMALISAVSGVILMYKAVPIVQKVQNMKLFLADEKITRKEAEEQLTDSVTIGMSDEDGKRILTKGVNTRNIPPSCHMDIIE